MAFTSFLGQDVGGTTTNAAGQQQGATGVKWGDLVNAAAKPSTQNQQTPSIATGLGAPVQGQQNVFQIQPVQTQQQKQGGDAGDIGEIMQVLGAIYGAG